VAIVNPFSPLISGITHMSREYIYIYMDIYVNMSLLIRLFPKTQCCSVLQCVAVCCSVLQCVCQCVTV